MTAEPAVANFWQHVKHLPPDAPSRRLVGHLAPKWEPLAERLDREGIRPTDTSNIIGTIFRRGWAFWLSGNAAAPQPFVGVILEPRYGAVWALYAGETPAQALGGALALCLDQPPWERGEEDLAWMDERGE